MTSTLLHFALSVCLWGCGAPPGPAPVPEVDSRLAAQSALFERGVHAVAEGVWVATGFGLANSILLEAPDGVVIVDTMSGRRQAEAVLAAFRAATGLPSAAKPVRAVILTHHHSDHVFGGKVFVESASDGGEEIEVPVYAQASTSRQIDGVVNALSDAIYRRSMRMFGQFLPPASIANAGIGPAVDYDPTDLALARPTEVVEERRDITVAGLELTLVHAPGESPDQLFVWLPKSKVLLPGDNIYRAFPNLYTIRGTAYRDVRRWVASLDLMRDLGAEVLVPSHTTPVVGEVAIAELLTAYRDAIQYVHDQTVRGINKGASADELAAQIQLPPHLANHPWLAETYGTVAWSVRAIFDGYLGWFDGYGAHLDPLSPEERARKLAAALEAGQPLAEQAKAALASGDVRWAAELADHWLRLKPKSKEARRTLASALEEQGKNHPSANGRHYLLSQAAEVARTLTIPPTPRTEVTDEFVDSLAIGPFMAALPVRLKAEQALQRNTVVHFYFPDVDEHYTVHLRHGVAEIRHRAPAKADLSITVDAKIWKRIAFGKRSPVAAVASGELQTGGGLFAVVGFLNLFER